MMAAKAHLFNDYEKLDTIMQLTSPRDIKMVGRQISNFDAAVWEQHPFDIAVAGNYAKLAQNSSLRPFLFEKQILVKASPVDAIWGIGLAEADPRCVIPKKVAWP